VCVVFRHRFLIKIFYEIFSWANLGSGILGTVPRIISLGQLGGDTPAITIRAHRARLLAAIPTTLVSGNDGR